MKNSFWYRIKKQSQKDFDAFFGKKYRVWVINTKSNAKLFLWENWKNIYPEIDSILNIADTDAFIRTFQSYEFENKWLGFGRMKWNEDNNKKWTTKYLIKENPNKKLQFFNTEIWTPDWNKCIDNGEYPEVFVNIYHHFDYENPNEGILIAIKTKYLKKNNELLTSKIQTIKTLIPDSIVKSINRYWTPSRKFVNRIDDMNPQELEMIINEKR